MKKLVVILIAVTFFADSFAENHIPIHRQVFPDSDAKPRKIEIDYASNRNLLSAVLLFPDSMFPLGGWKLECKKEWYNEVKSNNFWIAKDSHFFNQWCLNPSSICFSIIDGSWVVSLYETTDNSFIVFSHEIIGDGNYINIVETRENEIVEILSFESLFGNFSEQIKQSNFSQECTQKLIDIEFEHYFWLFDFFFSGEQTAKISSAWFVAKDEFKDCLKGNTVLYKFNPETKKFEIEKIYWE